MYKLIDATLSAELHELYLENIEWLSEMLSMEDEMKIFKKSFGEWTVRSIAMGLFLKTDGVQKGISALLEKRSHLKEMLQIRIKMIEQLMAGSDVNIGLEIVGEDKIIISEIKSIIADDFILRHHISNLIPVI
jgi:hypothetical protein